MINHSQFNFIELVSIFGEENCRNFKRDFISMGVSTDTRTIVKGNIFVALKGEIYDGHANIQQAIDSGASAVVVSIEHNNLLSIPTIIVSDTLVALGELATFHRSRFDIPIIAVAGSNGKTSTKELIYAVLSRKYRCLKTYKNFNNRVGVPQMLLQLSDEYDIAIIEIGTNMPGEIAMLSNMGRPTHGIITNIGKEHLELLSDLDMIEIEETFLYGYLLKTGGKCFINADDERLNKYSKVMNNAMTYGIDSVADFVASIEFDKKLHPTIHFKNNSNNYSVTMQAIGLAIAYNAIAAAAVGYGLGLSGEEIVDGLSNYSSSVDGYARMAIEHIDSKQILNDCYNANPSSMEMSLKTLSMMTTTRKIAVLGDMLELGEATHTEHIATIKLALDLSDEVLVIGENMAIAAKKITNSKLIVFSSIADIATYINGNMSDVAILIKASRGMKLEELILLLK